MTKEEIEQLVAAEVDRRLGGIVGQIGKDLQDRYATKVEVGEKIDARAQAEMAGFNRAILQAAGALRNDEKLPANHPFAVLVQLMNEQLDLEMRIMELGLYIVADNVAPKRDGGAMEQSLKLTMIKKFVADREHGRLFDMTETATRRRPEVEKMIEQFADVLGPRPEEI